MVPYSYAPRSMRGLEPSMKKRKDWGAYNRVSKKSIRTGKSKSSPSHQKYYYSTTTHSNDLRLDIMSL